MFEKRFHLAENRTTVHTELAAGLTTFMTMAYILAVNPVVLSEAGMPHGGVFVATALAAMVGTLLMGLLANYPFVLAPGMGLNAYLAYTVCGKMGYSWQFALLAVFVEGLVFLVLSLTPVREIILNSIPDSLKKAISAGIGLFICFIALQKTGLVVFNEKTLVDFINFREADFHTVGISAILAIVGILLTSALLAERVKGALLIGILSTWGFGMVAQAVGLYVPAGKFASLYPNLSLGGVANSFAEFGDTFGAIFNSAAWKHTTGDGVVTAGRELALSLDFLFVMFAFCFMDLFDTIGTLIGISMKGGFLDWKGELPRARGALCADAIATSAGALFGTSTTTTFVESATGVAAGGRTGLTAVTAAALFGLSILLAPVFLSVPAFATAPALVVVGYMMVPPMADIRWSDACEGIPAFIAFAGMSFTYSVSHGIMLGIISYTAINALAGRARRLHWILYVLTGIFIVRYAMM